MTATTSFPMTQPTLWIGSLLPDHAPGAHEGGRTPARPVLGDLSERDTRRGPAATLDGAARDAT